MVAMPKQNVVQCRRSPVEEVDAAGQVNCQHKHEVSRMVLLFEFCLKEHHVAALLRKEKTPGACAQIRMSAVAGVSLFRDTVARDQM